MRNGVSLAIAAAIGIAAAPAAAVVLSPHGTGQVLIYPYYTVNAGFGTLLSVVNTTADGKALKVRFREGYNARDVLDFNLYLSPYDVWVAQVFDAGDGGTGGAAVATYDRSCTTPGFLSFDVPGPRLGSLDFLDLAYTGANADGGPSGLERTREGYVEIIEMGVVTNAAHATLDAITHSSGGVPSNCGQIIDAWSTGGYWTADATVDIGPPGGGLYGAESIINVGEGLLYTVNAEAIDGFSTTVQHTDPGNAKPDLASATKSADGTVSAFVPVGSGMVEAKYDHPEDAISALFMVDSLYNEYVIDSGVGAQTDWIVTLPSKRFYTDPAFLSAGSSSATHPFDEVFSSTNAGMSCAGAAPQFWSREELTATSGICPFGCLNLPPSGLCFSSNSAPIGSSTSALGSRLLFATPYGPSTYIDPTSVGFTGGHMRMDLTHDWFGAAQLNHVLVSTNGISLRGLPAIGFAAIDYVNGNVTPGTLANYSGAYPHRSAVACAASPPAVCP
jgi:hypothetical protein